MKTLELKISEADTLAVYAIDKDGYVHLAIETSRGAKYVFMDREQNKKLIDFLTKQL